MVCDDFKQMECARPGTLRPTRIAVDPAKRWWSKDTIAVVTGGNRGIGYEIVRQLVEQGLTVVLTSRDSAKGHAAVETLKAEGLQSVVPHPLDVTSSESVQKLASWLKSEFGGIDILVNNAAVLLFEDVSYEGAKVTLDTNYYGVKNVTEGLLPLLRASPEGARIVNVSGRGGLFERFSGELVKEKFRNKNYTFDFVDSLATQYLEVVKAGHGSQEKDWPYLPRSKGSMYGDSKVFLNAYSIALEKSLSHSQSDNHKIFVVSYCTGPCLTGMVSDMLANGYNPPIMNTAAEGAYTGEWLALLPQAELAGKSGKFFAEAKEFSFFWKPPY